VRVGLAHEGLSVPSSINMLATLFILYILEFLVFVDISATEVHILWKFQLSNFHGSWDTLMTDGRTDNHELWPLLKFKGKIII